MNEKIKLPYYLVPKVWKKLELKGIKRRMKANILVDDCFSIEELAMIKSLSFKDEFSLKIKDLSYFPNLENLSITTTSNTAYTSRNDLISITDKDVLEIEKMTNLKILEIDNQQNVSCIDISKLNNLQVLRIVNNDELEEIMGLDKNRSIEKLDIYNLNSMYGVKDFYKFISENDKLEELNCDVLYFPDCIGYSPYKEVVNINAINKIKSDKLDCTWIETCGKKLIKINNYQMGKLHQKSRDIVNKYCDTNHDIEVIIAADRYLAENVKYNYDALDHSSRGYYINHGDINILSGPVRGANGAYDAIINNCCVCEGYTRAMQYLLKLKGIESANVSCISGKDTLNMSDMSINNVQRHILLPNDGYHSICKVLCDQKYYYCDPCWDACRYQKGDKSLKYLLRNKEQIKETHTLSYNEQNTNDSFPMDLKTINYYKNIVEKKFTNIEVKKI